MESRSRNTTALALDLFEKFSSANSFQSILSHFRELCRVIGVLPGPFEKFFPVIKETLASNEMRELLAKYEKRASIKYYNNGKACRGTNVLIIGAGPCGLRTAIEAQLLGAHVLVLEKRKDFSRKNVLHIWPFVITELRALGAKKFCPKFCAGSIDHVSICQLQSILLKIALLLGVQVQEGMEFKDLCPPAKDGQGWKAAVSPGKLDFTFDVIIGADGRQNILPGFKRKELRAKLAIAITANFINRRSAAEARVQEISGVSFIFKQAFFQDLSEETGIDLENIVYYKDETHYFVMTAKKQSLLAKGVLKENFSETADLLAPDNIDSDALQAYTLEAVNFATEGQIPDLEFAVNARGQPDVAIFDFTSIYAAENACRVIERNGARLLMGLVGDSLLEPFWPTGSGCARGFLSAMDVAWMIRSWSMEDDVLEVLAERETIYRLLAQTTHENLSKDHANYSVDPQSRYPNLVMGTVKPYQVKGLFDTDDEGGGGESKKPEPKPELKPTVKVSRSNTVSSPKPNTNIKRTPSLNLRNAVPRSATAVDLQSQSGLSIDGLMCWIEAVVRNCGIQISGIHDIFVGGDVLCALVHCFRPDLIPEYPFPPEIEEGIEEEERAVFRNQIAFDFLHQEYGLPYVISGYDSVEYTSRHLEELINYLNQVYDIFTSQETRPAVRTQSKVTVTPKPDRKAPESSRKLNRSATMPSMDSNKMKPVRKPGEFGQSILKLQNRFNGSGLNNNNVPDSYRKFNTDDLNDLADFRQENEKRLKRLREADRCKSKALQFIEKVKGRRAEVEKQAQASRRQNAVKSIKAIYVAESGPSAQSPDFSTVHQDDFFNEYNMRLWRKSQPTIGERREKLENVFGPNLPSKKSEKPKVVEPVPVMKPCIEACVKVNKDDWVMKLLAEKFGGPGNSTKGQGKSDASQPQRSPKPESAKPESAKNVPVVKTKPRPVSHSKDLKPDKAEAQISRAPEKPEPEPCFYAATTTTTSSTSFMPQTSFSRTKFYNNSNKQYEPHNHEIDNNLDEVDEDVLASLDPIELEMLEAWSGKYL